MFEEEAKEYSIENYETCLYDDFPYTNDARVREQSFKDGAEFSYNKANEWHYTKDGNLPEVDNRIVLCICGDGYIDENKHYILKLLTKRVSAFSACLCLERNYTSSTSKGGKTK